MTSGFLRSVLRRTKAASSRSREVGARGGVGLPPSLLGRENAAVLSAIMNTSGDRGGVLNPVVLALLVERFHDWNLSLYVVSACYGIACLCWLWIRPEENR